LTKIVKLISETIFLKIILLDAVFSASRKAFHTTLCSLAMWRTL